MLLGTHPLRGYDPDWPLSTFIYYSHQHAQDDLASKLSSLRLKAKITQIANDDKEVRSPKNDRRLLGTATACRVQRLLGSLRVIFQKKLPGHRSGQKTPSIRTISMHVKCEIISSADTWPTQPRVCHGLGPSIAWVGLDFKKMT